MGAGYGKRISICTGIEDLEQAGEAGCESRLVRGQTGQQMEDVSKRSGSLHLL